MEHTTSTTTRPRPHPAAVSGGPAVHGGVPRPAGPAPAGARGPGRPAAARRAGPVAGAPRRGARRTGAGAVSARLPAPRLTGLGCGVLAAGVMAAAGGLSRLLGGGLLALYGVTFLLAALAAALWVRPGDLVCAPVAVPIAYAVGLLISDGFFGLLTELALGAPWLFAGTGLATTVVLVRQVRIMARRIGERRRRAASRRQRAALARS